MSVVYQQFAWIGVVGICRGMVCRGVRRAKDVRHVEGCCELLLLLMMVMVMMMMGMVRGWWWVVRGCMGAWVHR